jgi:hypothetical protein
MDLFRTVRIVYRAGTDQYRGGVRAEGFTETFELLTGLSPLQ